MATYTSNYAWTKPEGSDPVDITVLNNNLDSQDNIVHNAYMQFAPVFSTSATYAVGDVVLYANNLYKCITAVTVAGAWDSSKWTQVKVSDICGGGGGGTSDYSQLTNKPSINSVTLSGNKTSADLGLQDAIQIDTMPTASATYDGKIVQFVGTTTASYTHGYYYECVENNGVYSWIQTNVQPSSGGGGGTSDYTDLTNKPQINGVTLTGNKSTSDLGIDKSAVGLSNVPNVATDDQTPTFTTAQSRNNLVSGEKLSIMLGKISRFFNDLKTVAFTGSFSDLSNKPENANTFQGTIAEWNQLTTAEKKAYDHASITGAGGGEYNVDKSTGDLVQTSGMPSEYPASKVMLNSGDSVEEKIGNMRMAKLWENPSPTSAFASQSVTLSSNDYDLLLFVCDIYANTNQYVSDVTPKGKGAYVSYVRYDNGASPRTRAITRTDDTHYSIADALVNGTTNNNHLIPIAIYGIKLT